MSRRAVVVGAGPAGLTAADELQRAGWRVLVLEKDPSYVGGLARTVRFRGLRFDVGGHRFFSRRPEIREWWERRLGGELLEVKRRSRILYGGRFFDYPLRPLNALSGLGLAESLRCVGSWLAARARPRPVRSFEDWVSNRFGRRLFEHFFKSYTEKVWGVSCSRLSADWAAQRIRNLTLGGAIRDALLGSGRDGTVRTLAERFRYPRLGPGMMWEKTRDDLLRSGAEFELDRRVTGLLHEGGRVRAVRTVDAGGVVREHPGDAFLLSMPLRDAVGAFDPPLETEVRELAGRLQYRDFLVAALAVQRAPLFPDQWIYVHDPSVRVGRVQNFNNWSPELVPEPGLTLLGLEYFGSANEAAWARSDEAWIAQAKEELGRLGLARPEEVVHAGVVRMEKAYPVYSEGYREVLAGLRRALERFGNLQLAGRAGLHRYDNQDHAMLTGLLAARNLGGAANDVWAAGDDAYLEGREAPELPR